VLASLRWTPHTVKTKAMAFKFGERVAHMPWPAGVHGKCTLINDDVYW
jgi:hypothetical protein